MADRKFIYSSEEPPGFPGERVGITLEEQNGFFDEGGEGYSGAILRLGIGFKLDREGYMYIALTPDEAQTLGKKLVDWALEQSLNLYYLT